MITAGEYSTISRHARFAIDIISDGKWEIVKLCTFISGGRGLLANIGGDGDQSSSLTYLGGILKMAANHPLL
jgi:hypothetical protein